MQRYAALADATFTPDLYACAISDAGVSDIPALLGSDLRNMSDDSALAAYDCARIGGRYSDIEMLREVSPALHADQVKAPILLPRSADDLTVSVDQSKEEAEALIREGGNGRFVELEGDDRYLKLQDARLAAPRETETFLALHLGR